MSIRELVKRGLTEKQNREYRKALAARQVPYEEWIAERESAGGAGSERGIAAAETPESGPGSEPQFCVFYSGRGRLADCALENIRRYFEEHPEAMIVYGDEDVETGSRRSPWFKPDWSPDTFLAFFYFGSVTAVRRELLIQAAERQKACGMENDIWDWEKSHAPRGEAQYPAKEVWLRRILSLVTLAGGFHRNCHTIHHLPGILFHCDSEQAQEAFQSWRPEQEEAPGVREAQEVLEGISVIIPSKDNPEVLKRCLESLITAGGRAVFEVIVVDNGSSDINRAKYEKLIQDLINNSEISYLYHPMEFNFSQMCNLGARAAKGRFFLFLNDDVELAEAGTLEQMAQKACRPYVGAVGIKLYYPGSRRMQHDGITNLPMGPVHKLQFLEDDRAYAFAANRQDRNALAVTGACLMVEKSRFWEAGGFPEELPVAFNDVDLCFSLFERGYHNLVLNSVYAYHHESLSRGEDESEEKLARLLGERGKLYRRHPGLEGRDPYYAWGWNREGLDTRIRPAYETAGNKRQELRPERAGRILEKSREDACLLIRVESCGEPGIQGYGVVLGDNNACYIKSLIWKKVSGEGKSIPNRSAGGFRGKTDGAASGFAETGSGAAAGFAETGSGAAGGFAETASGAADSFEEILAGAAGRCGKITGDEVEIWIQELEGQYRPDLTENMQDQENVGLCGFAIDWRENALPAGAYRLGMLARNRVTGLKLINWSNRFLTVGGGLERQERK